MRKVLTMLRLRQVGWVNEQPARPWDLRATPRSLTHLGLQEALELFFGKASPDEIRNRLLRRGLCDPTGQLVILVFASVML